VLNVGKVEKARLGFRREFDQQVDIAIRPCIGLQHRPEQRQAADLASMAQRPQSSAVGKGTTLKLHR
jgi:hypothetical protein